MPGSDKGSNERRGLASADEKTKKRVASEGGKTSRAGGDKRSSSSHGHSPSGSKKSEGPSKRGLASAEEETRGRVARTDGKTSHGGHGSSSSKSSKGRD